MASIEVLNMAQINPEEPIEIQLHDSNITYRGPEGPMGPAGRDGVDGARGKSAYEVAIDNGFVGSQVEWLASLKGADGAPGRDGQDGAPGQDGKDGQDGAPGRDGQDGATGPQGPEGPAGKDGKDGQDGQDGAPGQDGQDGVTPVKGVDYFTSADIADIVAAIEENTTLDNLAVYSVKAWYVDAGTNYSNHIDLRNILNEDITTFETIWEEINDNENKTVILWMGKNGGNHPSSFNIDQTQMVCGLCKKGSGPYGGGVALWIYPLFTVNYCVYNPAYLTFDSNGLLQTTQLIFPETYIQASRIKIGLAPNQTDVATVLSNKQDALVFNTAYNATSNKVATMTDISNAISNVTSFGFEIVTSLPTTNISTSKIYLVLKPTSGTNQVYTEYIYANGDWEILGDTQITVSALSSQEVQTIWNTASTT